MVTFNLFPGHNKDSGASKEKLSNEVSTKIKKMLPLEYDLYHFVKQRLHFQVKKLFGWL